jgi:diguanylate cyclase (GGDEF)-like protein
MERRKSTSPSQKGSVRSDSLSNPGNGRVQELTFLLEASRKLSNILNPQDLFPVLADLISKELEINKIAIFIYNKKAEFFELAFQMGLGDLNFQFAKEKADVLWQSIARNEPFAVCDESGRMLYPELFQAQGLDLLRSRLWAPLVMTDKVIGVVTLGAKINNRSFSENDQFFLKEITSHASVCINASQLYLKRQQEKEELDKTLYNLSILYSISRAMTYISDLKSLLQYIMNQAIEITSAEKGSIMLYDLETNLLTIRVLAGLKDKVYQDKVNNGEIKCKSFKPGEGIAGRVFQTGVPMVIDNAGEDECFIEPDSSYVRSIVCIPMMVFSEVLGVINVTNKLDEQGFCQEDVEMLKAVADQAAVAINKAQLWEMAVTDSLTGLFVRRYFMAKFQEEIHRAERYKKVLSVVMADLDRFKRINDTYGHTAGDRVLRAVGKFLQKNIRDVDILARYGGEEFVLLLPEADKYEAHTVSERLRKGFSELQFDALPRLTISLGIASYPQDGTDLELLIKRADAAMYAAKQAGRNRVVKYDQGMERSIAKKVKPAVSKKIGGPKRQTLPDPHSVANLESTGNKNRA